MSATLMSLPPSRAYNGDDIWITLLSDNVDPNTAASIELVVSGAGPSLTEEITITWPGVSVTLTVESDPNNLATAWPVKGAEPLSEYVEIIAEILRSNGQLNEFWHIQSDGVDTILLTFLTSGVLDVTVDSTLSNVAETVTDGLSPYLQPNLACLVQVWKAGATATDDELLGSLHAPYNAVTGEVEFNLKNYFDVSPHLPTEASIAPTILLSWPRGVATSAFLQYYIRYADKYGVPPVPEAMIKMAEGNYYITHGSRSADRIASIPISPVEILHRYIRNDAGTFRKPIGDGVTDYLYLWATEECTGCSVEWDVIWDSGDTTNHPYVGSSFTLAESKIHWLRTTPLNFNFTPLTPGALPIYFTFRLKGNAGSGVVSLAEVKYAIHPQQEWEFPILMDNGLGACETVLFYGKAKRSLQTTKDTARRPRTSSFSIKEGELFSTGAEGQKIWELNTGWHERYYIEHIQQLLLGQCWFIDKVNKRFAALICGTSDITTSEDDQDLFSLSVQFKAAWIDTAINL